MYVIGHDDVSPNSPAMSFLGRTPFVDQNVCDLVASKKLPAIFRARRHKIHRGIYVDALQSSQVLVYCVVVAEGADHGNPRRDHARPRSAPAATALTLRGEHRFGIGAGDFTDRDPADSTDERAG